MLHFRTKFHLFHPAPTEGKAHQSPSEPLPRYHTVLSLPELPIGKARSSPPEASPKHPTALSLTRSLQAKRTCPHQRPLQSILPRFPSLEPCRQSAQNLSRGISRAAYRAFPPICEAVGMWGGLASYSQGANVQWIGDRSYS